MTRRTSELRAAVRPAVVPVAVAVVLATFVTVIGMRARDGVLIGLAAAGVLLLWPLLDRGAAHDWPDVDLGRLDGSRRDVTALSWTLVGRDGRVAETAVRRLRVVAERRLARHGAVLPGGLAAAGEGVNPADAEARARELLGDRAWRALVGRGGLMPSPREVQHCVDVLERLGPDQPGTLRRHPDQHPDQLPGRPGPTGPDHPVPDGRT